jgi:hypothetical protein
MTEEEAKQEVALEEPQHLSYIGKEFIADFIAMQVDLPKIAKNKDNPFYKSKYADLASIIEVTRPILAKHNFAVTQLIKGSEIITMLLHTSGQYLRGMMEFNKDLEPQKQGAAITYLRRHALKGILHIADEEDDDDGNSTVQKEVKKAPEQNGAANDILKRLAAGENKQVLLKEFLKVASKLDKKTREEIQSKLKGQ